MSISESNTCRIVRELYIFIHYYSVAHFRINCAETSKTLLAAGQFLSTHYIVNQTVLFVDTCDNKLSPVV